MVIKSDPIDGELIERLLAGDILALSTAITIVENNQQQASDLLEKVRKFAGGALIVGITGAPGVGKSTLISAYISHLRSEGRRVAVVSVDPSSPLTGGAILGDRLRMTNHILDPDVFIRSSASRGHLGGLCRNIKQIIQVIDSSGWDVIVLETVGTGQSEIEIAEIAQIKVVVNSPGMGDDIQAMKSGILEIADILVVNKADRPNASRTISELRGMLKLREASRQSVPVLQVIATEGKGVAQLSAEIDVSRNILC